jgi:hypothetical protein
MRKYKGSDYLERIRRKANNMTPSGKHARYAPLSICLHLWFIESPAEASCSGEPVRLVDIVVNPSVAAGKNSGEISVLFPRRPLSNREILRRFLSSRPTA